jgi:hypothetical protein
MKSFWDKKCDAIRKHLEEHLGNFMGTLCELGRTTPPWELDENISGNNNKIQHPLLLLLLLPKASHQKKKKTFSH